MRTTLDLDDHLMRRVRRLAAETGRTLTSIVELGLREVLDREKRGAPYRFRWVTVPGGSLPGVDLADRDALFERMEGRA
jgi:hypothetical protein